jgi:hypothetical protein
MEGIPADDFAGRLVIIVLSGRQAAERRINVPEGTFCAPAGHDLCLEAGLNCQCRSVLSSLSSWVSREDSRLIMNDHDGPGVVPGRYAGEAIPIHEGPTPQQVAYEGQRSQADGLAGRICAVAADAARSQCVLLELLAEFDAIGGLKHWSGFKSLAHWLSWSCSMTPGVARQQQRQNRNGLGTFRRQRLSRPRRSVT